MAAAVAAGPRSNIPQRHAPAIDQHVSIAASTSAAPSHRPSASTSSINPPPKSFKRIFRSSLQETLRTVSTTSRKAKDKDKDSAEPPSAPPSAFFERHRPSVFRRSLDSQQDKTLRANGDGDKVLPGRRSIDALTQKSTSTSVGSQSGSDRERDRERPRVLRKADSRAAAKRRANSPPLPPSRSLVPSPIPPEEAHTGPGWAPFVYPTLSKGSMSSPHLTLGRSTDPDHDHADLKPSRRQRSPLTSLGAFLYPPRTRRASNAPDPKAPPKPPSKPSSPTPTSKPSSPTPASKPSSPTSKPSSPTLPSKPSSPTSASKPASKPFPLSPSSPSRPRPARPVPPPLTISRPKAMLPASPSTPTPTLVPSSPSSKRSGAVSPTPPDGYPSSNGRASPGSPKGSRVIGLGHPSTSSRRLGTASRSTSHLPIPSQSPTTPSPPSSPTPRARSPTASTTASRARATSPTTVRAASPATPRGTSPSTRLASASTPHLPITSSTPPGSPRLVPRRTSHGHSSSVPMARTHTPSPSPSVGLSPSPSPSPVALGHRAGSASTSSLVSASMSPQRETIRRAANVLVREMVHRRGGGVGLGKVEWEEVENRMRGLARLERVWGKGGAEDRERRIFGDAVKDGYVLCQFVNKLRPGTIPRVDGAGTSAARAANVAKFLAAVAPYVPPTALFSPPDIRVTETVLAVADAFQSNPTPSGSASASTPNLLSTAKPASVALSPKKQKRWSPPAPGLATVRSDSPVEQKEDEEGDVFGPMEFTEPFRGGEPRISTSSGDLAESSRVGPRISTASATSSDATTAYSSLLDPRASTRYGTIRTMTTEATSLGTDAPSLTRTEGSSVAASLAGEDPHISPRRGKWPSGGDEPPQSPRRASAGVADLSRVEETDEGSLARPQRSPARSPTAIQLGKGKWPDDFMSAFQYPARTSPITVPAPVERQRTDSVSASPPRPPRARRPSNPIDIPETPSPLARRPSNSLDLSPSPSTPPPRTQRGSNSLDLSSPPGTPEPISPLSRPRRRSRNSTDMLLPKDLAFEREPSPVPSRDSSTPSPGGGRTRQPVLRRASTRSYVPRTSSEERTAGGAGVPFPSSLSPAPVEPLPAIDTKRARHRSDIEKTRRSSFGDPLGMKMEGRSRYESMVNLGGGGSDSPKGENSLDGSTVRKTVVVKEEGKPATHYQLGNCIGRGQFGSVYRALNLNTGQMVAVKCIRLEGLSETEVAQLMHEVELVKRLSHPSIVKYEGMARDSDTLNIVLEYAENGSLAQTLKAFGKLNEKLVASYVTKVLEGLHYLHGSQVVHCDLKAANILTTKTGNVKLSDFGVSLNLRAMEQIKNDVAGTPNWMAPEVIELKGASPASDIWSLACTIIELLTGRPPYADIQNGMSVMFRIVEDPKPPIPNGLSEPLQDFLNLCFNKDPKQRPDAEVLFEHPWLKADGWGIYKELRPQDSIPFLRRVSADLQRSDVRQIPFVDEDRPVSPRSSNGGFGQTSEPSSPRAHSFVKSTFSQPVTCRVCNLPVKKSAVFCTECSLIAHSKCAIDVQDACDLRAQVIRLSHDLQRDAVVRQQSPTPTVIPTNAITFPSGSPPKHSDSSLSSSPATDRFRLFGRKKSKTSTVSNNTEASAISSTPPVAFKDTSPSNKRSRIPRSRNTDDGSHSRASITSSHQSSTRSAATAAESLSSTGTEAGDPRRGSAADSDLHRASRITGSSLANGVMMSTDAGEEAFLKRKGTRREKGESESSRTGCVVQ